MVLHSLNCVFLHLANEIQEVKLTSRKLSCSEQQQCGIGNHGVDGTAYISCVIAESEAPTTTAWKATEVSESDIVQSSCNSSWVGLDAEGREQL